MVKKKTPEAAPEKPSEPTSDFDFKRKLRTAKSARERQILASIEQLKLLENKEARRDKTMWEWIKNNRALQIGATGILATAAGFGLGQIPGVASGLGDILGATGKGLAAGPWGGALIGGIAGTTAAAGVAIAMEHKAKTKDDGKKELTHSEKLTKEELVASLKRMNALPKEMDPSVRRYKSKPKAGQAAAPSSRQEFTGIGESETRPREQSQFVLEDEQAPASRPLPEPELIEDEDEEEGASYGLVEEDPVPGDERIQGKKKNKQKGPRRPRYGDEPSSN